MPSRHRSSSSSSNVNLCWEGAFFRWHSLAHVNREICARLAQLPDIGLSIIPTEPDDFAADTKPEFRELAKRAYAQLSGPADVHVRHFFPPRWNAPPEGKLVLMQPWEYGYIPAEWLEPIESQVAEVWCNSEYVKNCYLNSGVPASKLHLIPLGVDTDTFHANALPYVFTDEAGTKRLKSGLENRFVFLYVGGTIHRKGIDILLDAYSQAFSALDDVCLIIKDTGTRTVYAPDNNRERILAMASDVKLAPIIYLDDDLPPQVHAGIFTAAGCLVAPYRGEGFCLPVLEAMACGVPAVVPAGGPTDDFVDESVGWRIPAERLPFGNGEIGPWQCAGPTWMFEVDPNDLARAMRRIAANPAAVRAKGHAAAARVAKRWDWSRTVAAVSDRLHALKELSPHDVVKTQHHSIFVETKRTRTNKVKPNKIDEVGETVVGDAGKVNGGLIPPRRPQPTISLCMIVKNEERVLGDCLRSIKPWVDEMIVVDTGSTDGTVAIARDLGAQVHQFAWTNSFSEARNESLRRATGDWILWMDADDTIPEECGRQLHDIAFMAEDRVTGFIMQVKIPPASGQVGMTVVDHVKLFRNLPGLQFIGRIHEQILEPIYNLGGTIERTDLFVVHSGYDYSDEGQERKRKRDLELLALDLEDRPDHPFVLFNIGMTAYYTKDYGKAIYALNRCLQVSKPTESTVRKVYAMLAGCYSEQRQLAKARDVLDEGLSKYPSDPELLFRSGILHKELHNLPAAERDFLRVLNARETGHLDSIDVSITGFKARHNLALVYFDMARYEDAERCWRQALHEAPAFVPSLTGMCELYFRTGRMRDYDAALNRLASVDNIAAEHMFRYGRDVMSRNTAAAAAAPALA